MQQSQFQDVDKAKLKWFEDVRSHNIPIIGSLIRQKSEELGTMLGIKNLHASGGYFNCFCIRYETVMKSISSKACDVLTKIVYQ